MPANSPIVRMPAAPSRAWCASADSTPRRAGGCGSSGALVKSTLEAAMQNAAPDAASIVIEETGASLLQSGFVSVAQLESGTSMSASYVARAERRAD